MQKADGQLLRRMYLQMQRARLFEERVNALFLEGRMPGTLHLYPGQEACAVGVCEQLSAQDWVIGTHRPHGHAIAKGVSLNSMMAELFGKTTGCAGGYGGSMHVGNPAVGAMTAIAIVGGNIPVATGMALAFKMQRSGQVVCCFTGDGATNEGAFHEGVNMAAIWDLPVVFVIENNKYGASTPIELVTRCEHLSQRAAGYGIAGETIDGMDVLKVYEAAGRAIDRARAGQGPTLLECLTYRFGGHSRSDTRSYRTREEEAQWRARDPIVQLAGVMLEQGEATREEIDALDMQVERELDEAVTFAESSPAREPLDCLENVYSTKVSA
jgi:pyruvate dehydrogenase E1 component alpha subunit